VVRAQITEILSEMLGPLDQGAHLATSASRSGAAPAKS
jgi:hypothetical protein